MTGAERLLQDGQRALIERQGLPISGAVVEIETGLTEHVRPHNNPNAVLAAVLADACNLGIEKMADASQGISYAQLAWTHSWYLSDENYRSALATIINAHHALPLAAAWGAGTTSSSDGQYFRAGRRGGGHGSINAKYGADPGMLFYTHLSDGAAVSVVERLTYRLIRAVWPPYSAKNVDAAAGSIDTPSNAVTVRIGINIGAIGCFYHP